MPKVSLTKWEFTICYAEKFLARHAWIFLVRTVDVYYYYTWRTCMHTRVHTYWRATLYVRESNSFPLRFMRTNGYTSFARFAKAFAESKLKEYHSLNPIRIFFFHYLRAHPRTFVSSFLRVTHVSRKTRQFVGEFVLIFVLINLELIFLSRRFKILFFLCVCVCVCVRCNLFKFLTLRVLKVKFLLSKFT